MNIKGECVILKNGVKKGFTLIELMIVLAIIAILAVVLIPKAGLMKDNARNAGINTNVNSVRAVLETKVSDSNYLGTTGATKVQTLLTNNFGSTGSSPMQNPFSKSVTVSAVVNSIASTDYSSSDNIVVYTPSTAGAIGTIPTPSSATTGGNKGVVFVQVYTDGFVVEGIDSNGDVVSQQIVK